MTTITLKKGGTGEQTVALDEISIPDLWRVAELLREEGRPYAASMVLETWHLAHDLLKHAQAN